MTEPKYLRPADVAALPRAPSRGMRAFQRSIDDGSAFVRLEAAVAAHALAVATRPAALSMLRASEGAVYFVQCNGEQGPIKIGVTTDMPKRLRDLQAANPYPLQLLGMVIGGRVMESALHKRFASTRTNGEWFGYSAELRGFISELMSLQHRAKRPARRAA
jgi:hypothetical protein